MNVTIGGIARTVEITSFDKLGDVKVCMLTTTADGSVGFQQLNQEVIDTIYASFPVDTAKGSIASFEDGADNVPVRELKLNLEPYQNLNGYEHPWVGGAGKNKLPTPVKGTYSSDGLTLTVDDKGVITVSGTTTSNGTVLVPLSQSYVIPSSVMQGGTGCMYLFNSFTTGTQNAFVMYYDSTRVETWQFTVANRKSDNWVGQAGQTINKIGIQYTSGQTYNGKFAPMFSEDGTTDATSFIPYSNICPIYPSNGKNLLPTFSNEGTTRGITFSLGDNGTVIANGTATNAGDASKDIIIESGTIPTGKYKFSGCAIGGSGTTWNAYMWDLTTSSRAKKWDNSTNVVDCNSIEQWQEVYIDSSHRYQYVMRVKSLVTANNIVFYPMVYPSDIAETSYVPYKGMGITRIGKNLLKNIVNTDAVTLAGITYTRMSDGSVIANGTATAVSFYSPDNPTGSASPVTAHTMFLDEFMGQTLVVTGTPSNVGSDNVRIMIGRQAGSSLANDVGNGATFTVSETGLWVGIRIASGTTVNNVHFYPMIRLASITDSSYEPYQGERYYPISDNPVYGGTLEVETGVLTVTHDIKKLTSADSFSTQSDTGYNQYTYYADGNVYAVGGSVSAICTSFQKMLINERSSKTGLISYGADAGYRFALKSDMGIDTLQKWYDLIANNDVSFTMEYKTPFVYQLTPTQVKTLLGYNNIWTDSGTVEVQYRANIGLYIQKIIGSSEEDMVANQNISANKYFFVGEELYYSTSAISAGQTIVVGTNCIKTNLADALNALNS